MRDAKRNTRIRRGTRKRVHVLHAGSCRKYPLEGAAQGQAHLPQCRQCTETLETFLVPRTNGLRDFISAGSQFSITAPTYFPLRGIITFSPKVYHSEIQKIYPLERNYEVTYVVFINPKGKQN